MSRVRVLVGTRKGAFVLNADGTRDRWEVSGPFFPGWEIYHVEGVGRRPGPAVRLAVQQLVRAGDPALRRWRRDLGAGGQRVRLRRRPRDPPVVRRDAAPVGVRPGMAPGARRRTTRTRSTPEWRTPGCSGPRDGGQHWEELPGLRAPPLGAVLAARRGRDVPAHDHPGPGAPGPDLRRHLRGGRVPLRRLRADLGADEPGPAVRRASPTRTPRSATACTGSRCTRPGPRCCTCKSTGT